MSVKNSVDGVLLSTDFASVQSASRFFAASSKFSRLLQVFLPFKSKSFFWLVTFFQSLKTIVNKVKVLKQESKISWRLQFEDEALTLEYLSLAVSLR